MQDRRTTKKTSKIRKAARPNKAALCCYADNANKLGKPAAKRIFANVRLSVDRRSLRSIYEISRYFGYSASDTARNALRFAEAESHAERMAVTRKYEAKAAKIIRAAKSYQPKRPHYLRQRLPSKAELWANAGQAGQDQLRKNRTIFNLTAHNLADLSAAIDEMRLAGEREYNGFNGDKEYTLPPSVSMAFRRLIAAFLIAIRGLIDHIRERTGIEIEALEYRAPTRAKRNRTITEAKRRIIEQGTKTGL